MTSLLALQKPAYPQSFMLIYGFLFELWVSNLNEKEEEENKMKNSAHCGYVVVRVGTLHTHKTTTVTIATT